MSDPSAQELTGVLADLRQVQRELVEQRFLRRADGLDRVEEALRRLGEVGTPAASVARAAEALGVAGGFDTVVVSSVDATQVRPRALWIRDDPAESAQKLDALAASAIQLRYPLIEAEVIQRHEAMAVSVTESARRALGEFADVLGWSSYCVADLVSEGRAIGLVHASRHDAPSPEVPDAELTSAFAAGFTAVLERAVLREQVGLQLAQLDAAARWIADRVLESADGGAVVAAAPVTGAGAPAVLTARELEVLRQIGRGRSNAAIALALAIGEGTVKYHVKNILRKLQARSRAEAVSKYMAVHQDGPVP